MGSILKRISAVLTVMVIILTALPVNAQEFIYEDMEEVSEDIDELVTSDVQWPEIPDDWYVDYEYVLSGTDIVLKNYKKENLIHPTSVLVVPATAVIDGKTYNTVLDPVTNDDGWDPDGNGKIAMWYDTSGNYYTQLSALKVEQGVRCTEDASYLFAGLYTLQTLDVRGLDTTAATDMSYMFDDTYDVKELDVSGFDTSHVTSMQGMFSRCWNMNRLTLGEFDTSSVTDMSYMFDISGEEFTSLDLGTLETQNVTNMKQMICCANIASIDLSGFDTSKVTDMSDMFYNCQKLTSLDLSGFNTSKVTDMSGMFRSMQSIRKTSDIKGLTSLDTSSVEDMSELFSEMSGLTTVNLKGFNTSNVKNMSRMFFMCHDLKDVDISDLNTGSVTDMSNMFGADMCLERLDLKGLDTSSVTNMSGMFGTCSALKELDISTFDTSNVTDMSGMFSHCWPMTSFNIRNFNTSKVTDMSEMFIGCSYLKSLDISNFDTSNVTDFSRVFEDTGLTSMDLTGLDTSSVTNMEMLFYDCKNLQSVDMSALKTSKVKKMNWMFGNCENLKNVKFTGIDTSACEDFSGMFENCGVLGHVDANVLNVSSATNLTDMFGGCQWMKTLDLRSWSIPPKADAHYLISGSGIKELYLPVNAFSSTDMTLKPYGSELPDKLQTIYYAGTKEKWDALKNTVPENVQMVYDYLGEGPSIHAIEIRPSAITLTISNHEYGYLTAYDLTDGEPVYLVAWKSADPRIATVDDNGGVTPISAGKTTITALSNEGATATCEVTVKSSGKTVVQVTSVEISQKNGLTEVEAGKTLALKGTVLPSDAGSKALAWTSEDPGIAVVNSKGVVTGISPGKVKIYARPALAEYDATQEPGTYEITVNKPAGTIEVDSIKLMSGRNEIGESLPDMAAGKSLSLKAVNNAGKAWNTKAVVFYSSNEEIVSVTVAGKVKALKEGSVTIKAVSLADPSVFASVKVNTYVPVKKIVIKPSKITVSKNTVGYVPDAVFTPLDATNKVINWTSGPDVLIAAVPVGSSPESISDESFKQTATTDLSSGDRLAFKTVNPIKKCTVTALTADGNKKASYTFTVTGSVTRLELTTTKTLTGSDGNYELELAAGRSVTVKPYFGPKNAWVEYGADKTLSWESGSQETVTVTPKGKVSVSRNAVPGETGTIRIYTADRTHMVTLTVKIK